MTLSTSEAIKSERDHLSYSSCWDLPKKEFLLFLRVCYYINWLFLNQVTLAIKWVQYVEMSNR
jgi:hypothetical protein